MNTKKSLLRTAMVVVAVLLGGLVVVGVVYAAAVTVDSFDNGDENLLITSGSPPTVYGLYDGTGILGGERDSVLTWMAGSSGYLRLTVDNSNSNIFSYSADPQVQGWASVTWDGNDNLTSTLTYTGLNSVDLTDSGSNNGLLIAIVFDDLQADLTFKIYTDQNNWSYRTIRLPGAADGTPAHMDIFLPFSSFTTGGGSGATFSNVGAVVMELDGTVAAGVDVQIDFIEVSNAREYGDLPSSYSVISAYHIPQGLRLGKIVDAETTYQASTGANGDDNNPSGFDDEDGVQPLLLPWPAGGTGYVGIDRYGCPSFPAGCYINGWIDWNNDGDFNDALEHIVNNTQVYGDGSSYPSFTTPGSYSNGYYYARFRICPTSTGCDDPGESPVTNGEVEDYRWWLSPTAVELSSFSASYRDRRVTVRWETASELDLVGFNIYRSTAENGPYMRLNSTLIPAQRPGSPLGALYTWVDGQIRLGRVYYYKLEQLSMDGETTLHGPVQVQTGTRVVPAPRPVPTVPAPVLP